MTEQTNAQRLNARTPLLSGHHVSASDPLVTPAVQAIIDGHPQGADSYHNLARNQRHENPDFLIHHLDNGPSLVIREFEYEHQAVIMTEAESLNHYGPHRQIEPHHHHNASTGWGIAHLGSSMAWAIFLTALVVAFTLDCHPEFLAVFK